MVTGSSHIGTSTKYQARSCPDKQVTQVVCCQQIRQHASESSNSVFRFSSENFNRDKKEKCRQKSLNDSVIVQLSAFDSVSVSSSPGVSIVELTQLKKKYFFQYLF